MISLLFSGWSALIHEKLVEYLFGICIYLWLKTWWFFYINIRCDWFLPVYFCFILFNLSEWKASSLVFTKTSLHLCFSSSGRGYGKPSFMPFIESICKTSAAVDCDDSILLSETEDSIPRISITANFRSFVGAYGLSPSLRVRKVNKSSSTLRYVTLPFFKSVEVLSSSFTNFNPFIIRKYLS